MFIVKYNYTIGLIAISYQFIAIISPNKGFKSLL